MDRNGPPAPGSCVWCFVSRFVLRFSWFNFVFQLVSVGFILRFILFQLVAREGLRILQLQRRGSAGKSFSSPWQPQLQHGAGEFGCREGGASGTPPKALNMNNFLLHGSFFTGIFLFEPQEQGGKIHPV